MNQYILPSLLVLTMYILGMISGCSIYKFNHNIETIQNSEETIDKITEITASCMEGWKDDLFQLDLCLTMLENKEEYIKNKCN